MTCDASLKGTISSTLRIYAQRRHHHIDCWCPVSYRSPDLNNERSFKLSHSMFSVPPFQFSVSDSARNAEGTHPTYNLGKFQPSIRPSVMQELTNILDQIPRPVSEHKGIQGEGTDTLTIERPALLTKLHTYVFSATLTLPESYKGKLQRRSAGSKGSSGGASFDNLMDRIAFRGKPKVLREHLMFCSFVQKNSNSVSGHLACHHAVLDNATDRIMFCNKFNSYPVVFHFFFQGASKCVLIPLTNWITDWNHRINSRPDISWLLTKL